MGLQGILFYFIAAFILFYFILHVRPALFAPLYLRTLWRYTNAVIIIIIKVLRKYTQY